MGFFAYIMPVDGPAPVDPGFGKPAIPPHPSTGPVPTPPNRPDNTLPPGPPPTASHPIYLPERGDSSAWVLVYHPTQGWVWMPVGPANPNPAPK